MDFGFRRQRIDTIPEEKKLKALEQAAKHFNYIEFSWRDFNKVSAMSASAIKTHFGSWKNAREALKKHLQQQGLKLSPRPHAPQRKYSDSDLFDEMERIWQKVGQRPSRTEWESSDPNISISAYKKRFGSWTGACQKFIEYKMGEEVFIDNFVQVKGEKILIHERKENVGFSHENSRNVPDRLRLKVLNRDNFRCVFCGKSPATDFGTRLHIDHIVPFSKGGKSILENLQTLCEECNLGKGNWEVEIKK
jgi:hypothetical protein